ncbi:acyltransferase family protein [Auraticoccus monumenti]|uniref:Peptidoglycan/LPS O-acetylase OafA/YrhL, contains acyltransferase and SGNH-hydrolase domains n=1 Tax=Auraticoccus monumenti TaxID=675864 RepID=A0A1G6RH64_9ACTN|nr:acyltransferase family protein [Auraticoccus monumenti]SDD03694.1 Peptidoglycan/LPS O-acetylase OafA/YrhL, contains acyltransferase and SGNH-hydrolase domains [Auraticoccus monumenti]
MTSTPVLTSAVRTPSTAAAGTTPHRRDIQGLRAVAVVLVLAYHAGVPGVPGGFVGVDVFFVISGFLITGLIVREVERTGRLDLPRFYARRIRRLLPATAVVLLATAAATAVALPVTRWESVLRDIAASALYVVNWRLAAQSVDYQAAEQASSPVQHFWSLAVEEQFYVVWPLVILLVIAVHRRRGWTLRRALAVGLALIVIPSLLWSASYTATDPAQAYFVTTTRLWELGVGAFLVLVLHRVARLSTTTLRLLGWAGLAGIALSALVYDDGTRFPGLAALLPVLSAAAVLAAGARPHAGGAGSLLSWGPAGQVGDLSYSLYLWHWPFVVVGTAIFGREDGTLWWVVGVLLVCTSVVPAWFTYVVVEHPIHTSRPFLRGRAVLATLVVCTLLPVAAAIALQDRLDRRVEAAMQQAAGGAGFGAAALGNDPARSPAGDPPAELGVVVPDLTVVAKDHGIDYSLGCHQARPEADEAKACEWGDRDSDFRVALVGDSHALQWVPTVSVIAEQESWALDSYTKSACGFHDVPILGGDPAAPFPECTRWNERLMEELLAGDYDLVLTTGSNSYLVVDDGQTLKGSDSDTALAESYARTWTRLTDAGAEVVALANTPWHTQDVPDCLAANERSPGVCATPREQALTTAGREQQEATQLATQVPLVDMNRWICPREACSPVIGGVITFRDRHHITATYARTLAPMLHRELERSGAVT